ncbi:SPOR domain-containing protein [Sporolactobacillus sp. THM7-4]|nr:SPOR domain-containing protein [Sporolactobacillus sp. THM7-4]
MKQMPENKRKSPHVMVTFNGKKQTLDEWTKRETAADKEKLLNWETAFPENEDNNGSSALPDGAHPSPAGKTCSERRPFGGKKRRKILKQSPVYRTALAIKLFWLPVTAAIVVGMITGLTLLIVFTSQYKTGNNHLTHPQESLQPVVQQGAVPISSRNLELSVFVVQAGVYSSKASADQAASHLRAQGAATIEVKNGKTAIYIGATRTESQARSMAEIYQKQNIPAYQKSWETSVPARPMVLRDSRIAAFTVQGKSLIESLLAASGEASGGKYSPSEKSLSQVDKLLKGWNYPQTGDGISGREKKLMKALRARAIEAAGEVHSLKTRGDNASFNAFQQKLLETIALYDQLIVLKQ